MIRSISKLIFPFSALFFLGFILLSACSSPRESKVLLFFDRQGEQAPQALDLLRQIAQEQGLEADTSSRAFSLSEESLKQYGALVLVETATDSLHVRQMTDVERFVQAGGGLVSMGASLNTKYTWPWYEELLSLSRATEAQNPEYQEMPVKLMASRKNELPEDITAWSGEYDGGRAFYLAGESLTTSLDQPEMKQLLADALKAAMGDNRLDYDLARSARTPEENRFVKQTLVPGPLNEPTELAVLPDGKVVFTERKGAVKMYLPEDGSMKKIAQLDVHTKFEDGLMGIARDPDYYYNNWIYMYYSPAGEDTVQNLSRFLLLEDSLIMASEKIILQVPVQRKECCHTGGSIAFGPDGLLYLSTGDDTNPFKSSGYAPIDERPGRYPFDAQSSSANTNDLRGKILRIRVHDDATYTIPEGNLFPEDDPLSRPEIYVMGTRNSYRISVDQETGWLYWGDVGPDARQDGEPGTKGYDEVKQAKEAGFYGWPYFRGNRPYRDHDFATGELGDYFSFDGPTNDSPNNTGREKLPPFRKSLIWYPYDESPEFPIVGTGGRNAMAGPVYHYDMFTHAEHRFPEYYDEKLFIYDWMRNWIIAVTLDENGELQRLEPFLDSFQFNKIIDMEMGHDGNLYILEYGSDWFAENPDAALSRINYAEGNRAPIARLSADKAVGAAPFTVQFSAEGSYDYDEGDELRYEWSFTGEEAQSEEVAPSFTFEEAGIYDVKVKVTDTEGDDDVQDMTIRVGNQQPEIDIALAANETFYFDDKPLEYSVRVNDKEDGSLGNGISAEQVSFSFSYSTEGAADELGHKSSVSGLSLIDDSGCKACHAFEKTSVGPAYQDVAERYENTEANRQMLVGKILKGSGGNWGDRAMPAQAVSEEEAQIIVEYLMTLDEQSSKLPLSGLISPEDHIGQPGGSYVFKVAYTDQGGDIIGPLSSTAELRLRSARVQAETHDFREGCRPRTLADIPMMAELEDGSYFGFKDIDLTGISALTIRAGATAPGLSLHLRIDSADGKTLGSVTLPNTGKMTSFEEITLPLTSVPEGKHDIYFVTTTEDDTRRRASVDWIHFSQGGSDGMARK
jgi:cytochrome c